ncbi:MAG TPA: PLP-dependent aspartate aminotransferase family protein [Bryobacteraceae bacterium]|nr:PLP-dependent aspartate aminotransferase family protein [Bryobacteraceae bacterium]
MSESNDSENGSTSLPSYKLTHRELHPSTRAILAGYNSRLSERSVKPPLFRTSTFEFTNAEEGRQFFQRAYHLAGDDGRDPGLIYSRVNNPNVEIWEDKMVAIENGAAYAAAFPSGMNAITTMVLALVPSGGRILYTDPVYGGSYAFFEHLGRRFGFSATAADTSNLAKLETVLANSAPFDLIFLETPANPTMSLTDIKAVAALSRRYRGENTLVAVDNTFLGPVFQQPFQHGADLVLYSATKFLGGHSDLIAGIVLTGEGSRGKELMGPIKDFRTVLGGTLAPDTAWMLTRSLETCWLRMERQAEKAQRVASALAGHPKVARVVFPGLLAPGDGIPYEVYRKQCSGPGSMITFYLKDGRRETAYRFLNAVRISHLAVSLGGTESLIQHPRTMTHSDMSDEALDRCAITDGMIRLSVGLESADDSIHDLSSALDES